MDWRIDPTDINVTDDFEEFTRATVAFELWTPGCEIEEIRVTLTRVYPGRSLHRCVVETTLRRQGNYVAGVVGEDPFETVERAAVAVRALAFAPPASSVPDFLTTEHANLAARAQQAGSTGSAPML